MRAQFIKLTITNLQEDNIREEHDRSENLLINTFPKSVITNLNSNELTFETVPFASVLFSDIVSFTDWSSKITAEEIVSTLGLLFYEWDGLCAPLGVEKVKTIGDAYVACCGVTDTFTDHPKRIAEMALLLEFTH
jgi:adenylate cyclase